MRPLQSASSLQGVQVFSDRDPRYTQGFREILNENAAMLLSQRQNMQPPFFDQHGRAAVDPRRRLWTGDLRDAFASHNVSVYLLLRLPNPIMEPHRLQSIPLN